MFLITARIRLRNESAVERQLMRKRSTDRKFLDKPILVDETVRDQ